MRLFFALSLALNLLLLTTIVAARVDATRASDSGSMQDQQAFQLEPLTTVQRRIANARDLSVALRDTGFDGDTIESLVFGWLLSHHSAAYRSAGPQYWQAGYLPGLNDFRKRVAIEQQLREELLVLFGAQAAAEASFEPVFRPLGTEYAFLSSSAQLEFQHHQLQLLESGAAASSKPAQQLVRCATAELGADTPGPESLPDGMPASAVLEYQLRFSPLAQQIRASGISVDELQFRRIFGQVLLLEQRSKPEAQAEIRAQLRETMGSLAFDRFWSTRDPFFAALKEYLSTQGFSRQRIFSAYSLVNQSQENLLEVMGRNSSPQLMWNEIAQVRADERAALVGLVGKEVADGLSAALNQASIRLSTAAITEC
jgi:hypothetical protein